MTSYPPTTPVPASERPTLVDVPFPRPPRVPTRTNYRQVDEVRYDLAEATQYALSVCGHTMRTDAEHGRLFDGLGVEEIWPLAAARAAVIMAATALGRRGR